MSKYQIFNLIRKVFGFPFVVIFKGIVFIFLPLIVILGFFTTNWEDKDDRDYYIQLVKDAISFGLWK